MFFARRRRKKLPASTRRKKHYTQGTQGAQEEKKGSIQSMNYHEEHDIIPKHELDKKHN
jgi:hypothetical protein